jgi:hypothetical protein
MERNARSSIGRQAECDARRRSGEATFKHGGRIAARGAERDSSCSLGSARVLPGRKALDAIAGRSRTGPTTSLLRVIDID